MKKKEDENEKNKKKKSSSAKSKSKRKKKRGRPKKRGRKKGSKNRKKKKNASSRGFGSNTSYNRVRKLLWDRFKSQYPSYQEFIRNRVDDEGNKIKGTSIVSKVYNECKSLDCSDEDILAIYKQLTTTEKGESPLLPSDYFEPRPYYELLTVDLWDGLDERVWIVSPMLLPAPPEFLGILGEDRCVDKENQIKDITDCNEKDGDRLVRGKKELFQPFVTYCNQFQQRDIYTTSDDVPHVKFIGETSQDLEPFWNEGEQRWEVEIVPCTPFGEIYDYDFDPSEYDQEVPDEDDLPIFEKPTEESEKEKPSKPAVESEDLTKVKIEETKKTAKLDRLIKKKSDIREDIKLWKEIEDKDEMKKSIAKLKEIQKEIDKLDS